MMETMTKTPVQPEPWLRGTHTEVPALLRAVLHALEHAKEDVELWCSELTDEEMNARPLGLTPVAFHLRHISRSTDRLLRYAEGEQLSPDHIAQMKSEMDAGATRAALFAEFARMIDAAKLRTLAFRNAELGTSRGVGRKALPTSVGGLLVHVADHTQRHVGQVVTTAKVLLAMRRPVGVTAAVGTDIRPEAMRSKE